MPKGRKTGGRVKGTPNKSTASVKAALVEAFDRMGGVKSLIAWGRSEPTEFYKLWAKMLPQEVTGKDGGPIETKAALTLKIPKIDPNEVLAILRSAGVAERVEKPADGA